MRGTFANIRLRNRLAPGTEGGWTRHQPSGSQMSIYDASLAYKQEGTPLIVLAGSEYGTGSSRDWAAKGTLLLGIKAVIAKSFERIHRSNLIGMGVLPLNFKNANDYERLALDGSETFDILGLSDDVKPMQEATLVVHRADGSSEEVALVLRLDTPIEVEYYRAGGILPFVLQEILRGA